MESYAVLRTVQRYRMVPNSASTKQQQLQTSKKQYYDKNEKKTVVHMHEGWHTNRYSYPKHILIVQQFYVLAAGH